MRKIVLEAMEPGKIRIEDVHESTPIFAKKNVALKGMVVQEHSGWILRIGGAAGADGHHSSRTECLESCLRFGFEFFIED